MLSLSHTTGYAIQALCALELSRGRRVRAQEIASQTGVPKPYLSKILHALGRAGLIWTKRGYRGGVLLSRPAAQISLLNVVEAVEGVGWRPRCLLGPVECSDERACPTHAFWKNERDKIEAQLRGLSIAQVAAFERQSARRATAVRRRKSAPRRRPLKGAPNRSRGR